MKTVLAVVILGGLLYLEAVAGYVAVRRAEAESERRRLRLAVRRFSEGAENLAETARALGVTAEEAAAGVRRFVEVWAKGEA